MTVHLPTRLLAVLAIAALAIAWPLSVRAADPLTVVRDFCRADGAGKRLSPSTWRASVAPLVAWPLEPAWDRLVLVGGYEMKSPRRAGDRVEVEVTYSVIADISPGKVVRQEREDKVTFELIAAFDGSWILSAAPFPPHVFESVVDADALAALLAPGSSYESNTDFVWKLLRDADWEIPYMQSTAIPDSAHFEEVGTATAGDLILYYSHGVPYHLGWMLSDDTVASTSLNAGRQTTPFAAYPGHIRYWRPRRSTESGDDPVATPSPAALRRR